MSNPKSFSFWWAWLVCATAVVMLFGLGMVLLPGPMQQFFDLMLSVRSAAFDRQAMATLISGVLGATMVGWGAALIFTLFGTFRQGKMAGWWGIALPMAAWFILDTSFSLWTGFWQNAALNLGFAILYALPLAATYRVFRNQ